jgi:lipoprotein NlpI
MDFAQVVALDRSRTYSVLWLHLARAKMGNSDTNELSRNAAEIDLSKWSGRLISLFLGKATPEQTRAAAAQGDPNTKPERDCDAPFYIAEYELQRQNLIVAKTLLQEAVNACSHPWPEYDGAVTELKRLK